jgi:tetraacyldisaccharide 4'-kinase
VLEHRFEDHYSFTRKDIVFKDDLSVIMTEKDAVKCNHLIKDDESRRYWYLPVTASVSDDFSRLLDKHIERVVNEKKAA